MTNGSDESHPVHLFILFSRIVEAIINFVHVYKYFHSLFTSIIFHERFECLCAKIQITRTLVRARKNHRSQSELGAECCEEKSYLRRVKSSTKSTYTSTCCDLVSTRGVLWVWHQRLSPVRLSILFDLFIYSTFALLSQQ